MKLSTGKKDKNVLSLYLNSSGDIVPSKENASEPIISFKENAKITDILTTKSAANLSMSKKQLINIETTVPGYKHGFVLQTGTGFSRKTIILTRHSAMATGISQARTGMSAVFISMTEDFMRPLR